MRRALRPAAAAWFRSSRRMLAAELSQGGWLSFGPFRWADIDIPRALRAGAGMITPLALGLATGHLEYGVFAALGALPAGLVSFQGASRTRVSAVVFAALGMAVATFAGAVAVRPWVRRAGFAGPSRRPVRSRPAVTAGGTGVRQALGASAAGCSAGCSAAAGRPPRRSP